MTPIVHIADADPELPDLYRRFFTHYGWQVEIATGGLDCLARLRQTPPQLLILDCPLPRGGPDGVLAVMRNDRDLCRIPVILTFTSARAEMPTESMSPPVVRALAKPFALKTLLEHARAALEIRP